MKDGMDFSRLNVCSACGKKCLTREQAGAIIRMFRRKQRRRLLAKIPTRAYKCEDCGAWHVTSLKKTGKRGKMMEMKKKMMRAFKIKPFEITSESGRKYLVDDDIVIGNMKDDGGFSGAVFESGEFQGSVSYTKEEWNQMRGEELFMEW